MNRDAERWKAVALDLERQLVACRLREADLLQERLSETIHMLRTMPKKQRRKLGRR